MQLQIRVLPAGKDQTMELEEGADGFRLMDALKLNPDAHLILKGDRPIPGDSKLRDGDHISIVSVISGG
ncbi:MAG: thiamine biosynthesis protein ThiS [Thermoplasmata archaeon]